MRVINPSCGSSYDRDATNQIAANPITFPIRHALMPNHLESGYKPYPLSRIVSVVAAPAVIQTGAVGANPWDYAFGNIGQPLPNPRALPLPPQVSKVGY